MTNSSSDVSHEHVEEWRLAYLEDLLSPDERSRFEEHIEQCHDCAKQVEDMSRWVALLKDNRDAFCPEQWELFDYARESQDVTSVWASHLGHCPACRKTITAFRTLAPQRGVPDALWEKMTRLQETPARQTPGFVHRWLYRWWEQLTAFLSPPLTLAGAVAAAILVVVFLYPYPASGPFLGLRYSDLGTRSRGTEPHGWV